MVDQSMFINIFNNKFARKGLRLYKDTNTLFESKYHEWGKKIEWIKRIISNLRGSAGMRPQFTKPLSKIDFISRNKTLDSPTDLCYAWLWCITTFEFVFHYTTKNTHWIDEKIEGKIPNHKGGLINESR